MSETSLRRHQESMTVDASAEAHYDLVSDITRIVAGFRDLS